jgi:hypothetical protein
MQKKFKPSQNALKEKKPKSFQILLKLYTNLNFQHKAKISSFQNPHIKK